MGDSYEKKRKRYEGDEEEIIKKVAKKEITEAILKEKLTQHVEQVTFSHLSYKIDEKLQDPIIFRSGK